MKSVRLGFAALAVSAVASMVWASAGSAAPTLAASLWQCVNGPVGPPLLAQPCVGSNAASVSVAIPGVNGGSSVGYSNWVTGNANGNKSHWQEGDYISYRAVLSGIPTGMLHTLVFHYDTVSSKAHAIDYLGGYDATETAATAPTTYQGAVVHADNASPCADLVAAGTFPWACTPAAPQGAWRFPAASFSGPNGANGCSGSKGTFGGVQEPGAIELFGPAGSEVTGLNYLSQDVLSGQGTCTTTVQVTFTVPQEISASQSVVLAWGGHIAAAGDWGAGASASSINGSPYHMILDTLDGTSLGSREVQLQTSAIYFTPQVSSQVTVNGAPLGDVVPLGATVRDISTLTGSSPTAGGTATYRLYPNGTCSGTPITTQQVTVTNALVPASASFVPTAGDYGYRVAYNGAGIDLGAVGSCEPFTIGRGEVNLDTTVVDAATNQPVPSPVPLGESVYDSAVLTTSSGTVPTGTVTYSFYGSGNCTSGTVLGTQTVTLAANGSVPNSPVAGPLTASGGPYAYRVGYSGDANFGPGTSECEPFTVAKGDPRLSTSVFDASTNQAVPNPVPPAISVYDTTSLSTSSGVVPTGTVTYTFFSSGDCTSGTVVSTDTVTVAGNGSVPPSSTNGPITAAGGPYAYRVGYSGDADFAPDPGECETFAVGQDMASLSTTVDDAATNQPLATPAPLGVSVYDTTALSTSSAAVPTGTVSYTFFSSGDCTTGTAVGTDTVTLAAGSVPKSSVNGPLIAAGGPYAYSVRYSGDINFTAGAADCEPLTVQKGDGALATSVFGAATGTAAASPVPPGSSVYDTATLTDSSGVVPTGTVTYSFFGAGDCATGTLRGTDTVTLAADGSVPSSSVNGPLSAAAGPYDYRVTYSGDANFVAGSSDCEPFTVGKEDPTPSTTVLDASTKQPTTSAEPLGSSVYDTTTLIVDSGLVPSGTVTYTFFSSGDCTSGTTVGTDTVTLAADGSVPSSSVNGPLTAAGVPYAYLASYSGDANFLAETAACEPLDVDVAAPTLTTTIFDAATHRAAASPAPAAMSVYDTATLTTGTAVVPTGTVTYTFFADGDCTTGAALRSDTVTLGSDGSVPSPPPAGPAAGPYAYDVQYSGDANYIPTDSQCETLAVVSTPVGGVQAGVAPTTPGPGGDRVRVVAWTAGTAGTGGALVGLTWWALVRHRRKNSARHLRRNSGRRVRASSMALVGLWSVALAALALILVASPVSPNSGHGGRPPQIPVGTPPGPSPTTRTSTDGAPVMRVSIPSIGVDSPVDRLGLNADGTLQVPANFAQVGWWEGGAVPGAPGPAVLVGHVSSTAGPAVFARLAELPKGSHVVVTRPDGSQSVFAVAARTVVRKSRFPTSAVYGPVRHSELRLVTCGGPFDRSTGHFADNVIVFASLVTSWN